MFFSEIQFFEREKKSEFWYGSHKSQVRSFPNLNWMRAITLQWLMNLLEILPTIGSISIIYVNRTCTRKVYTIVSKCFVIFIGTKHCVRQILDILFVFSTDFSHLHNIQVVNIGSLYYIIQNIKLTLIFQLSFTLELKLQSRVNISIVKRTVNVKHFISWFCVFQ